VNSEFYGILNFPYEQDIDWFVI